MLFYRHFYKRCNSTVTSVISSRRLRPIDGICHPDHGFTVYDAIVHTATIRFDFFMYTIKSFGNNSKAASCIVHATMDPRVPLLLYWFHRRRSKQRPRRYWVHSFLKTGPHRERFGILEYY